MNVDTLRRDGLLPIPTTMERGHVDEFLAFLQGKPLWDNHVAGGRQPARPVSTSTSWAMEDVVAAPHFWEFALALTPIAEAFLGQPPLLYSLNAFTTYPMAGPLQADIQEFHRDRDDGKFLVLFLLCSDIPTVDDGPHEFVKGSHLDPDGRGADGREVIAITGSAGTAFMAATFGLHRGVRPKSRPRTMAWARWGISDPPASYGWDKLSPMPREQLGNRYPEGDEKLCNSIRLVVR